MHVGLQWEPFLIKHVLTNFDRKKTATHTHVLRVHAMNFFFTGRMAKRMLNKYRCHLKTVFLNICPYQIKTTTLA